ncbi:Uu.00g022420.m01.CDS01 [Anthostomella pinea]|uniref:Uu.00g022420.m01.CDS01 n=1 Tax=Anthostomella pinea TaxID=933095 RepID=A0AAI8VZV9_9PEZI|nr:Uu.00g022420.m01.CDS01 [Anthostomella pinea]
MALWLTDLPADCTYQELLAAITDTGKVFSTHITHPVAHHAGCAATIAFFTHEEAQTLLLRTAKGQFMVRGAVPCVRWNTNKSDGGGGSMSPLSRVLRISGKPQFVNQNYLAHYLQVVKGIYYDTGAFILTPGPYGNEVEWRFTSYRAQAELAFKAITKELAGQMIAWYGEDPCR